MEKKKKTIKKQLFFLFVALCRNNRHEYTFYH